MSTQKRTKIYILGAGCSAGNGYPTAENFVKELEDFGRGLGENATRIKKCVESTVELMRRHMIATVDDLAARVHSGCFIDSAAANSSLAASQMRDRQIKEAKIATAAMLLAKEKAAKETGLKNYHDFALHLFPGGSSWERRFLNADSHILTFNYDRLFELAIMDRAEPNLVERFPLYGEGFLNSGLNFDAEEISFNDNRFCFLKLHGSAGISVRNSKMGIGYPHIGDRNLDAGKINDRLFFSDPEERGVVDPWPLLVFPVEKHHVQSGGRHIYYEQYLQNVWKKAETLISMASEIFIIGYSFQAIDRNSLVHLLGKAENCERGVIQNLPGEAEKICEMLKVMHPEIQIPWIPYSAKF